jgi:hypothetical protein
MPQQSTQHPKNTHGASSPPKKGPSVLGRLKTLLPAAARKKEAAAPIHVPSPPPTPKPHAAKSPFEKITLLVDGSVITVKLRHNSEGGDAHGFVHSNLPEGANPEHRAAIYAIEELILEHAIQGIDIKSDAYRIGISRALTNVKEHCVK